MAAITNSDHIFHLCRWCSSQDENGKKLLRCSRCKSGYYCSKDHQKADWREHKTFCKENTLSEVEIEQRFRDFHSDIKVTKAFFFALFHYQYTMTNGFVFFNGDTKRIGFFPLAQKHRASELYATELPIDSLLEIDRELKRNDPYVYLPFLYKTKKHYNVYVITSKEYQSIALAIKKMPSDLLEEIFFIITQEKGKNRDDSSYLALLYLQLHIRNKALAQKSEG